MKSPLRSWWSPTARCCELPELTEHCRNRLAAFKVPKQLVIRDQLPRNPSGKVLKRVLRAELEANA